MKDSLGTARSPEVSVGLWVRFTPQRCLQPLLGHRDTSTWNPAAHSCTSSVLRAANCSSSISCAGHLLCWWHPGDSCNASQTDICHRTCPSVSLGGWRNADQKVWQSERSTALGSHPTLAPSASFLWHLVCKFVLCKLAKIIFACNTAEFGLSYYCSFKRVRGGRTCKLNPVLLKSLNRGFVPKQGPKCTRSSTNKEQCLGTVLRVSAERWHCLCPRQEPSWELPSPGGTKQRNNNKPNLCTPRKWEKLPNCICFIALQAHATPQSAGSAALQARKS